MKNYNNSNLRNLVEIALILLMIIIMCVVFSSCGLTRIVSTTASHIQHGDTTTTIVTKSTTSYDAKTSIPIGTILH